VEWKRRLVGGNQTDGSFDRCRYDSVCSRASGGAERELAVQQAPASPVAAGASLMRASGAGAVMLMRRNRRFPDAGRVEEEADAVAVPRDATKRHRAPFTGEYWNCHKPGTYHCIGCDAPLFGSDVKFDSGTAGPVSGGVGRQADRDAEDAARNAPHRSPVQPL